MGQLDGKIALVTAGGGGIGQATAMLLAERGAHVIAADIDPAGLDETRKSCTAPERLRTVVADATTLPGAEAAVRAATEVFGGLSILVNVVGGSKPGDLYTEAEAGEKYLKTVGIPANRLTEVNSGNDTLTSLQAAAEVLRQHNWTTAVLVSDPWHMFRSEIMASDSGIDSWTSPTHSGPVVQSRVTQLLYIGRETAALLFYRATRAPADGIGLSLG